jgi:hypothetical protein
MLLGVVALTIPKAGSNLALPAPHFLRGVYDVVYDVVMGVVDDQLSLSIVTCQSPKLQPFPFQCRHAATNF